MILLVAYVIDSTFFIWVLIRSFHILRLQFRERAILRSKANEARVLQEMKTEYR